MLPSSCLDGSVTPVGPGQSPQYTGAVKDGRLWVARQTTQPMSPITTIARVTPTWLRSTVIRSPRNSDSQWQSARDEVLYTIVHEDEIKQPDGETVKKVMINETSTILSTVRSSKVLTEGLGSQETRLSA